MTDCESPSDYDRWVNMIIHGKPMKEPNVSDESIEQEIQRKGLNAPRVTPARLEEMIVKEEYHVFGQTTLTVCCLTLKNGFTVTGESACASPENFNAELGQRIARENAKQKIWALEGYALRERLALGQAA